MDWETIGGISEFLGAIAVVATLLYLAKEIRQNSRALQVTALADSTQQWHEWGAMLAGSSSLADIVARGNESLENLSPAEALRYGAWAQAFFDNAETNWRLVSQVRVEKDLYVVEAIVGRRIGIPGIYDWWRANREDYADDFNAWVEGIAARR